MSTPFAWPIRVYWEDTDAGGIVFYANYLKFFERSRTEWLRAKGIAQQQLKDSIDGMFVVSDVQMRYLKGACLDDELSVTTALTEAGRASMTVFQQAWLTSAAQPVLLCEATIRAGWVDARSRKPTRIPQAILDTLT